MRVHLHVEDQKILVAPEHGVLDERFRGLPDSRWLPSKRMWKLPATPFVARRVRRIARQGEYTTTPKFDHVYMQYRIIKLAQKQRNDPNPPAVPVTKYDPWLHQRQAYNFSWRMPAAMLAMDMGTGKTKVVVDILQNDPDIYRTLVVCSKKAIEDVWAEQVVDHLKDPSLYTVLPLGSGTIPERTETADDGWSLADPVVYIVNYEAVLYEPLKSWIEARYWDLVVLDESHRIKGAGSKISNFFAGIRDQTTRRLALSGTPFDHSPLDIYGQYRFLDPGIFGTNVSKFQERYAEMGGYNNYQVLGYKNLDELRKKFYQIAFRVEEDVLDLPPTQDIVRKCSLEPGAMKIYREFDKEFTVDVMDDSMTADNVLVKMTRLMQMTSGYTKTDEGKKLERISTAKEELLADILLDLPLDEPIVIFCQFTKDIQNVKQVIESSGRTVSEVSGKCDELKEWKSGNTDVVVVQTEAGSESIDLTRSRYAIYFSLPRKLGKYRQSRKRVHRPGQNRTTFFIHLAVRATIDIDVMRALKERQQVVAYVVRQRREGRKR